ncbi:MAG: hypothetical protein HXY40_11150 [Chloroflexi bacterium]|nr:hypothetical protein [Chloroflexota bacterium]
MRKMALFVCFCLLTLAACQSGPQPTLAPSNTPPSPQPTSTEPTGLGPAEGTVRPTDVVVLEVTPSATIDPAQQATNDAINAAAATSGANVGAATIVPPQPGVLATVPATEDPEAALVFDSLNFVVTGGGTTTIIDIFSDGRVLRDGVEYRITPEEVTAIDDMLDAVNFFNLQGTFVSAGGQPGAYQYSLSVERAGSVVTLNAEDGLVPRELQELFSLLLQAGLTVQR